MTRRHLYTLFLFFITCCTLQAQTEGGAYAVIHLNNDGKWAFPFSELDSITAGAADNTPQAWLYENHVKTDTITQTRVIYSSSAINSWYYNIENAQTMKYLNAVHYDNSNYTNSVISSYNTYTTYKKDQPLGVTINCTANIDSVHISERPDFQMKGVAPFIVYLSGKAFTAINLVPGRKYYYRAYLAGGTVSNGHFYTLGSLRMIKAENVNNIRDIGGWKTKDGRSIQYGKIFRGAEMDGVHDVHMTTSDSILFHDHLDIRLDVDLRKAEEADSSGFSPIGNDVLYKRYNVIQYSLIYPDYYVAFRDILSQLREGHASYVHCWMGADRTGTLIYLLEALLGVPEEDLCKDFELTSFSGQSRYRNSQNFNLFHDRIMAYSGADMQQKVENIMLYYGITIEEIEEFRRLMLE